MRLDGRFFAAMTIFLFLGMGGIGQTSAQGRTGSTDQDRTLRFAVADNQAKTVGVFLRVGRVPLAVGVYLSTLGGCFSVDLADPAGKSVLRRTVTQPGLNTIFAEGVPQPGPWKLTVRSSGGAAVVLAKLTGNREIPRLTEEESAYLTLKEAWPAVPPGVVTPPSPSPGTTPR